MTEVDVLAFESEIMMIEIPGVKGSATMFPA